MNSKVGQLASTVLFIALVLFWSVSILAAEHNTDVADAAETVRAVSAELAETATADAADEASESIAADTKQQLDLSLVGPTSLRPVAIR